MPHKRKGKEKMIDLDEYINNSIQIKFDGEIYDILEPTIKTVMQVDKNESDINEKNKYEKDIETARILMNHNSQGRVFTTEEIRGISLEGLTILISEIARMRVNADKNPNLESQSQTER